MSESKDGGEDKPAKKGKSKLLPIALVVGLLAGGGGFYAVYSGMLKLPLGLGGKGGYDTAASGHGEEGEGDAEDKTPFVAGAYVHLDPLVISLGPQSRSKHLKVTLAIEVGNGREGEIETLKPRIIDILQGFLRAVDEREFELPRSMERLRAQMLRRVVLVTPAGAVRDLLIQEFLLN